MIYVIFTNMTLAIIMCLLYSISLIFIFFSKSNAKNDETKIYKIMLILNTIGLLLHLIAENVCYYLLKIPYFVSFIVLKGMLIYYFSFGVILLKYLVVASQLNNKRKIHTVINILLLAVCASFLFMPMNVHRDAEQLIFYTYGLDCNLTYYLSAVNILIMIAILAFQYKKIPRKKIIPLILFVIGCTISVIIQNKYPHITIVDLVEAVICCLMYFTIENPYENKEEPDLSEETIEEKYRRLREARLKEIEEEKRKQAEAALTEGLAAEQTSQPEATPVIVESEEVSQPETSSEEIL